jgi:penicillin G amidase
MTADALPKRAAGSRRVLRFAIWTVLVVLLIALLIIIAGWLMLQSSLPLTAGEVPVAGLTAPVTLERDALGIPTITASSQLDAQRALGFLHGQERFFQMDLLRRQPGGELAELFGPAAAQSDERMRLHRFRARALLALEQIPAEQREVLEAYARGVNEGVAHLRARPFEYVVLRSKPRTWTPEDTILVVYAMYLDLQDENGLTDSTYGVLRETVPAGLFEFLTSRGSVWDAPIDGSQLPLPTIPGPEVVDLRGRAPERVEAARFELDSAADSFLGSNNMAVDASVANGRAILAGDMHLGLNVPNIWYRASIVINDGDREIRATGATLPGSPGIVAGSNGKVAWAFTNSYGDWVDLVILEEREKGVYATADGERETTFHEETISLGDGTTKTLQVEETVWGPVIDTDHRGRRRALRWVAHSTSGANLNLLGMAEAESLEQAMEVAQRTSMPAQNVLIADSSGRIGWTLTGAIPRRSSARDNRLPVPSSELPATWQWIEPHEAPRLTDPPNGRLWSANARVVGGESLAIIGDGGYALGARAKQIRDGLAALDQASEHDLLSIQLDDRAIFLSPWHAVMSSVLTQAPPDPVRDQMKEELARWGARASVDSVGYRVVRAFRAFVERDLFEALTAPAKEAAPQFRWNRLVQREHPLWLLVSERPEHLVPPGHDSWDAFLLAKADEVAAELTRDGASLSSRSWGERNTTRIEHPMARSIPLVGARLSMPKLELPGDWDMPRAQGPDVGASQRMVVSPGRESEGIFHMPGGQSGHPLSPHFDDGHEAWARGEATPFLPQKTVTTLRLMPGDRNGPKQ